MKRLLALFGVVCSLTIGCYAAATYDPYYYDYTYYDPYYYGYDAWYAYSWVDPYYVYYYSEGQVSAATVDPNAAATAIAQRAPNYFTPSGCVTATASGSTVNYTFSNCAGQFGMKTISGNVTLTISTNANNQYVLTATSSNLTVNGSPYSFDVTATPSQSGSQRTVTITSHSRAPDQFDSRQMQGTITFQQGSDCVTVDGQGTTTRGSMTTTSTITGVTRCDDKCPTAGTVTIAGQKGNFTGTFDGSPTFKVTAPNGQQKTYNLQCQ